MIPVELSTPEVMRETAGLLGRGGRWIVAAAIATVGLILVGSHTPSGPPGSPPPDRVPRTRRCVESDDSG